MKVSTILLTLLLVSSLCSTAAWADGPCSDPPLVPTNFDYANSACLNFSLSTTVKPLIGGNINLHYPDAVTGPEIVTLYGVYGSDESTSSYSEAVGTLPERKGPRVPDHASLHGRVCGRREWLHR